MIAERNGHISNRSCPHPVTALVLVHEQLYSIETTLLPNMPEPSKSTVLEEGAERSH